MTWWLYLALLAFPEAAAPAGPQSSTQQAQPVEEPPEEDASAAPKEYGFNPLQAEKELRIGAFYFKKGSYRAALKRFEESLKWDPSLAEACLRIAETQTKLKNAAAARDAYRKYLELKPDAKDSQEIRKRIEKR